MKLSDADRVKVIDWLAGEIRAASEARRAEGGHSTFRRMTRYEYKYAMQDLLGLPHDFSRDLPPETSSEDGFKNSSDMLQMTAVQFAQYRAQARRALERATVRGERPAPVYYGLSMRGFADCSLTTLAKNFAPSSAAVHAPSDCLMGTTSLSMVLGMPTTVTG